MFAQDLLDMKEEALINHHIDMFNFFEGLPLICVCDSCKTAIISHKKYEDIIFNKVYYELAKYYGIAIMPARLRDEKFTSLKELNERIYQEVKLLNYKEFQKREYSRSYVFEGEEKAYLLPLPQMPYEYAVWKTATVNSNYHIQFERNYYSVPYQYLRQAVDLRVTRKVIEIYSK